MKNPFANLTLFLASAALLTFASCEKRRCTECYIKTNAENASKSYDYCGKESEIATEDNRLQNDCVVLQAAYPEYYFNCGCD